MVGVPGRAGLAFWRSTIIKYGSLPCLFLFFVTMLLGVVVLAVLCVCTGVCDAGSACMCTPTPGTPPKLAPWIWGECYRELSFGEAKVIGMGHGGSQRCWGLLARAEALHTRCTFAWSKKADGTAGRMGTLSRVGSDRKTFCRWQCYFRSVAAWRVARLPVRCHFGSPWPNPSHIHVSSHLFRGFAAVLGAPRPG